MKNIMIDTDKSYDNAYRLYVGEVDYSDLGEMFLLPTDHRDGDKLLRYYEDQEEYERCAQIVKHKITKQ